MTMLSRFPPSNGLAAVAALALLSASACSSTLGKSGIDGGDAGLCEYRASHSTPQKFSFSVTLPDGSVQSCATARSSDAGPFPPPLSGEVSGWVTEVAGTAFSLDTCAPGTGCSPAVYRFAIEAPDLTTSLPVGRRITVSWQLTSSAIGRACPQALVVNDGLPSDVPPGTLPALWLAGADQMVQPSIPLPFSIVQQALSCNPNPVPTHPCGGAVPPDDYALVFTPASGEPPLSLATGKTGSLAVTIAPGLQQNPTVHNLRSYQTDNCDDYWNWGWWASGYAGGIAQLE